MSEDVLKFDILILGAGPAGLSAVFRLKQLHENHDVCILEKGSRTGSHIMSGAVFEPTALNELFPDWKTQGAPLQNEVVKDEVYFFSGARKASGVPNLFVPFTMHNKGNYISSRSTGHHGCRGPARLIVVQ